MRKTLILLYGLGCYAVGLGTLVYMIGWLGNFVVPRSIDSVPSGSIGMAMLVNLCAFLGFGLQHSIMARPWFKEWWTKFIPHAAERSTYVLASGIALLTVMLIWQPMGIVIWNVTNPYMRSSLNVLYGIGWVILVGSTFALNHFDLFGLRQVWLQYIGQSYKQLQFAIPGPYRVVRHPIYVGWLTLAWAAPTMTAAHFAFAATTTIYILIAIQFEERDLVGFHGETYTRYREQTPMLIPLVWQRPPTSQCEKNWRDAAIWRVKDRSAESISKRS